MTTTASAPPEPAPALRRGWPDPAVPVAVGTLGAAVAAGAVVAGAVVDVPAGAGLVVAGALAAAAVVVQRRSAWTPAELGLAGLALSLLLVAAVRDAAWLVALCVLGAAGLGALAVSSASTWTATLLTPAAVPVAVLRALPWAARGSSAGDGGVRRWVAVLRTAVLTAVVLGVFGALLTSADAAFARLVELALPDVRLGELPARLVLAAVVAALVLGTSYLAVAPPPWSRVQPTPGRAARRAEWTVPVAALDLLLLAFLSVHSTVLFGGRDHVLRTAGLTAAEYARSGFGQLLAVTALVLVVVAAAVRWAPRDDPRDLLLVRGALGLLIALTLAVAASALTRLRLYEQAFGATSARLLAAAVVVELVVVLLLVAAAGTRWPGRGPLGRSLPRLVAASAGLVLLALAVVDADGMVASRNVDRALAGAQVDTAYLGELSADAVPALDRLPEPQRSCALTPVAQRLAETADDGWAGANAARSAARSLLAERPVLAVDPAVCVPTTGAAGDERLSPPVATRTGPVGLGQTRKGRQVPEGGDDAAV